MESEERIRKTITLIVVGFIGIGLGYYSLQGHLFNKVLSVIPFLTALGCFIEIFNSNKKKNTKKTGLKINKVSKQKFMYDPRIYYVLALILILIYPPMNYHENLKFIYFDGWHPITDLGGTFSYGDQYSLNLTYLGIEFIFISIVFWLFYKKKK